MDTVKNVINTWFMDTEKCNKHIVHGHCEKCNKHMVHGHCEKVINT